MLSLRTSLGDWTGSESSLLGLTDKINLHEAQILHGFLRYSYGFFAGRHLFQICAEIENFMSTSATSRRANVSDFCDYAADMLERSKP